MITKSRKRKAALFTPAISFLKTVANRVRLTALIILPARLLFAIRVVSRKPAAVQLLTRLKTDGLAGRDGHLFAGTRVPAHAPLARLHDKDAKTSQLDAITAGQRILHGIEESLNCLLGLQFRDSSFVGKAVDNV